jgi:general secretion pathway protein J
MQRSAAAGFTLLEVLVALVVFGLLMGGLTQGVRFGLQAWQTQARNLAQRGDLDAVDRTLRSLVAEAVPGDFGGLPIDFTARQHSLEFLTELPIAAGAAGTRAAEVRLAVDAAHHLDLFWRPHQGIPLGPPRPPTRTVLLDGVDRLDLSYWQPTASGGTWVRAWSAQVLPSLVRIRIVFPAADGRHYPDIVVAPRRDAWRP